MEREEKEGGPEREQEPGHPQPRRAPNLLLCCCPHSLPHSLVLATTQLVFLKIEIILKIL